MPIYEFVCESCGRLVERLQKLTDPPPEACPECNGKMAKIMSRNSFQLKGGGWYRDLYSSGGGGGGGTGSASKNESKPEPKSEPKTESAPAAPAAAAPVKKADTP